MTHGKLLLINVDMVSPNIICEHHGVDWPAADIWNYEKFKQNENGFTIKGATKLVINNDKRLI